MITNHSLIHLNIHHYDITMILILFDLVYPISDESVSLLDYLYLIIIQILSILVSTTLSIIITELSNQISKIILLLFVIIVLEHRDITTSIISILL